MPATVSTEPKTLVQLVTEGVEVARCKVEELRETLKDFDAKQQASAAAEKASTFFSSTLDKCQHAIGDLSQSTQTWKSASEIPASAMSSAFVLVSQTLADIKEKAHAYDEKYNLSTTVSAAIADPREQAAIAVATASSYAAQAAATASAQLQGVSDGLKVRIMSAAEAGLQKALPAAVSVEERLCITQRATEAHEVVSQKVKEYNTKYGVADKLKELDARYSLTQYLVAALGKAQTLDQRVTGGKVEPTLLSAYEGGMHMVGHVITQYEEAKKSVPVEESKEKPAKAAPVKEVVQVEE